MYQALWLCTYAENHSKLSFQTHLHSIKHSPWPPPLSPPVQAMGVCQSTFCMWFIIANITIHLMVTWSFHNDSTGSAQTMLKDHRESRLCDLFTPVQWLHAALEQAHSFQYTITVKPDQMLTQGSWVHPEQCVRSTGGSKTKLTVASQYVRKMLFSPVADIE